jgi:sucrose-phosphate synthase
MEGYERMTERRWQREQGRQDATKDMSEDLSEGEREKGDVLCDLPRSGDFSDATPRKKTFQRNFSDAGQLWSEDNKSKKLYIVLIR